MVADLHHSDEENMIRIRHQSEKSDPDPDPDGPQHRWTDLQTVCSLPVMEQRGTSRNPTGGFGFTVKCRNRDTVSLIKNCRNRDTVSLIRNRDTISMINRSAEIEDTVSLIKSTEIKTPFP